METPTFTCLPCNFTTSLKANLVRHQNTAKHIKICECQEVVSTTVIQVVNTENKEPINSVNNQILDKVEELMKKNESLEETIKKLQKTIEMMAWNMAKESIPLITPPTPPVEEEKNEPDNEEILISIPLEPVQPFKRKLVFLKLKYEDSNETVSIFKDENDNYVDFDGNQLTILTDEKKKNKYGFPLKTVKRNNVLPEVKEEINEPVVIPVSIPNEPIQEAPKKRIRNKVVLLEEEKKEEKKESFAETEKMMRMEMELKELKAKTSENPIDYIEDTHKYMCQLVQKNKRRQIIEIDTIYGLINNYSSQHLPTNLTFNEEEGLRDRDNEYRAMVIKFLKSELTDIEEDKRPLVYYKKQLYIRKIIQTDDGLKYQWFPIELNELITILDNTIYEFYKNLNVDDPALTHFMNHRIKEEKYGKVLDAIMPLILLK